MLPWPHRDWTQHVLGDDAPTEGRSTCHTCPVSGPGLPFRVEVKCCGFVPELPNFQVGALLDVPSVQKRIEQGVGVGPLGLARSAAYAARSAQTAFGRDVELACPHLVDGGCSVWSHREAICSTWFCRIDGGEAGQRFWLELRKTLQLLERTLAAWCAQEQDFSQDARTYYAACAEQARSTSWEDLRARAGHELRFRRRELRAADHQRRASLAEGEDR